MLVKIIQGFIETEGVTFDLDFFSLFNKCSLYKTNSYLKLKQVTLQATVLLKIKHFTSLLITFIS